MSEPYFFRIDSEVDFDGTTPISKSIADFERVGTRQYNITLSGGGVIPADFWGLLSSTAPKLVGVATKTWNPMSMARVQSEASSSDFRQELDITPRLQHVGLFAGDCLALLTKDGGRTSVYLPVNEMSEEDHVRFALQHEQRHQWRRFRIIRDTGSGFVANFNASAWQPQFVWDETSNLLVAEDNSEGPIPIRWLCLYPRHVGCFYTVRFANVDTKGRVHAREPIVGAHAQLDVVDNMLWSKVQFASHDDQLVLESHGPASGSKVIADIELVRARPLDRVRGRYTRGA